MAGGGGGLQEVGGDCRGWGGDCRGWGGGLQGVEGDCRGWGGVHRMHKNELGYTLEESLRCTADSPRFRVTPTPCNPPPIAIPLAIFLRVILEFGGGASLGNRPPPPPGDCKGAGVSV